MYNNENNNIVSSHKYNKNHDIFTKKINVDRDDTVFFDNYHVYEKFNKSITKSIKNIYTKKFDNLLLNNTDKFNKYNYFLLDINKKYIKTKYFKVVSSYVIFIKKIIFFTITYCKNNDITIFHKNFIERIIGFIFNILSYLIKYTLIILYNILLFNIDKTRVHGSSSLDNNNLNSSTTITTSNTNIMIKSDANIIKSDANIANLDKIKKNYENTTIPKKNKIRFNEKVININNVEYNDSITNSQKENKNINSKVEKKNSEKNNKRKKQQKIIKSITEIYNMLK